MEADSAITAYAQRTKLADVKNSIRPDIGNPVFAFHLQNDNTGNYRHQMSMRRLHIIDFVRPSYVICIVYICVYHALQIYICSCNNVDCILYFLIGTHLA